MKGKSEQKSLRDIILSNENIYKAIYCLESYVFEKGLLSEPDLKKFVHFRDKFDFDGSIKETIEECHEKLEKILSPKENVLFDVSVYFKIKKLSEDENQSEVDKIKYRPIHTASLIDQICMVCMLLPLMFEDTKGTRKKSELTKLIPHDFYGNIPSDNLETLFKPWGKQYKSYTDNIIEHCNIYRENHRYKTEISLDIKNFFPSISPEFIFNFIRSKLSYRFPSQEDKDTLDLVLSKLLIYNIKDDNLKGWENNYYGDKVPDKAFGYFSRGIAQGLPQSYFFGNLCMAEIRKKIMNLPDFHSCDSYFYVDDSVIYIANDYTKEDFDETISSINDAVSKIGQSDDFGKKWKSMNGNLSEPQCNFQSQLSDAYMINFHKSGKSEFCRIQEAGMSIFGLGSLLRNVSMASAVFSNVDENEDLYSKEKLEKISCLVDDEIKRLKKIIGEKKATGDGHKDIPQTRLKLLKRYKRFFLYRLRFLEKRLEDEVTDNDIREFEFRYMIHCFDGKCQFDRCKSVKSEWFEKFDEEIFQTEARMLISMLPYSKAKKFLDMLRDFEHGLVNGQCGNPQYLFFTKDFSSSLHLKAWNCDPYSSLAMLIRDRISPMRSYSPTKQKKRFEQFSKGLRSNDSFFILPDYTEFVFKNSDEYKRMILNAYYSVQNEIEPSDARTFTKYSSRPIHYTELRILTRLRNKNFDFKHFLTAIEEIDAADLDNRMTIDMGLLEVINIFISKVSKPEWIDNIILTHRVVKGLWYNGSKFMNSYTLHNEEHAVTLIKAIVSLVKAIDYLNVKQTDYYILFLACYLHDISMVIHPPLRSFCADTPASRSIISEFIIEANKKLNSELENGVSGKSEKDNKDAIEARFKDIGHLIIDEFEKVYEYFSDSIRSTHPVRSAEKIREWKDTVLKHLAPLLLSHVAKISESHGYDVPEVYGLKSEARCSLVSEKYSMILIRLADLMDVANDRINYNLLRQNVSHMAPTSQFHWVSHLITDEIRLSPTYQIDNDENSPIENRRITENLNFNLFLNVKYVESIQSNCERCLRAKDFDEGVVKIPDEYDGSEGITLELFGDKVSPAQCSECPIICRWTMKKHEWFIKELKQLNDYLNSVNDRLFVTKIRFNIIFRDEFPLERDLYDKVRDYILK